MRGLFLVELVFPTADFPAGAAFDFTSLAFAAGAFDLVSAFTGAAFTGAFAEDFETVFAGVFAGVDFLLAMGALDTFLVERCGVERLDVAPVADFARGFVAFADGLAFTAFAAGFLATAGFTNFVGFFMGTGFLATAFTGFFVGVFAVFFFADAVGFFTGFLLAMMLAPMLVMP